MDILTLGGAGDIGGKLHRCMARAGERGLDFSKGSFFFSILGGTHGGHPWRTRYIIIVTQGAGYTRDGVGRREALSAGQAACWDREEWFAFDASPGTETRAVTLQGADAYPGIVQQLCEEDVDDAG